MTTMAIEISGLDNELHTVNRKKNVSLTCSACSNPAIFNVNKVHESRKSYCLECIETIFIPVKYMEKGRTGRLIPFTDVFDYTDSIAVLRRFICNICGNPAEYQTDDLQFCNFCLTEDYLKRSNCYPVKYVGKGKLIPFNDTDTFDYTDSKRPIAVIRRFICNICKDIAEFQTDDLQFCNLCITENFLEESSWYRVKEEEEEKVIDFVGILKATKNLLSNKSQWTQGCRAKDENGHSTNPIADNAVQWSVVGAIERVCITEYDIKSNQHMIRAVLWMITRSVEDSYEELMTAVKRATYNQHNQVLKDVEKWNDSYEWPSVIKGIDLVLQMIDSHWYWNDTK